MSFLENLRLQRSASPDPDLEDILGLLNVETISAELNDPDFASSLDLGSGSTPLEHSHSGSEASPGHAASFLEPPQQVARAASVPSRSGGADQRNQRPPANARYTSEAKLARNREAQRRFKMKQKVVAVLWTTQIPQLPA